MNGVATVTETELGQLVDRFYAKVRDYYDFNTWELIDVIAQGDIVFSTSRVRVAGQPVTMHIAERFRFSGETLVEVRVFISEA